MKKTYLLTTIAASVGLSLLTVGVARADWLDFIDLSLSIYIDDGLSSSLWASLFERDPCDELMVNFIVSPEPGWCYGNGTTSEVLADSTGEMELPDPNETRRRTEEEADSIDYPPDVFEVNPEVHAVYAGNANDRAATKMSIDTVLGQEGQQELADDLEATGNTVTAIATEAENAQNLDVTQDVMKATIRLMAQQSTLSAAMRTDSLNSRIDQQFTNLNLVNISRTLDESQRARRVEAAATGAKVLYTAAQVGLF